MAAPKVVEAERIQLGRLNRLEPDRAGRGWSRAGEEFQATTFLIRHIVSHVPAEDRSAVAHRDAGRFSTAHEHLRRALMWTDAVSTGQLLEVACDESGYEGENHIGASTDVFAHASVRLNAESATNCVQEIRRRIRSPALEYKSNHLLREKHRSVLKWLIGPSGPIHGVAHVHLTDKTFFVVGKVIDLLLGEVIYEAGRGLYQDQQAKAMAVTLYREGQRTFGRKPWEAFLESFNDLMRASNRRGMRTSVDSFFRMVDVLRRAGARSRVDEIMEQLWQSRPHADSFQARLLDNPKMIPPLDPLVPAILRAVVYWGEGKRPVGIIHDEHTALTQERIAQLKEILNKPRPTLLRESPSGRLTSVRLVDSRSDSRVQVADFLAGVARKIASDQLNGRGDAELTGLLRPYVDSFSIWGDDRSWSLLAPTSNAQS